MYGTVATLRVKPGAEAKLNEMAERWWRERAPKVRGALSNTVYRTDRNPNEFIMAAVFDSKESYMANADDPEQDKWYQEMRALLEADPVWVDGEIVSHRQR
jgi:quinol monooxygenase YgiN